MSYFLHNKAGGGEDTRPDHVGYDENNGGEKTDLPSELVVRMIFHSECIGEVLPLSEAVHDRLTKDCRGETVSSLSSWLITPSFSPRRTNSPTTGQRATSGKDTKVAKKSNIHLFYFKPSCFFVSYPMAAYLAPACLNNFIISLLPAFSAADKAVSPVGNLTFTSAPLSMRSFAISVFPLLIAKNRGVQP